MICSACRRWMAPKANCTAGAILCPTCGHAEPWNFLPLFIVTGPSGAGKTAVIKELQSLLPEWEVFETDILWDSAGDWKTVKCNWLRIAAGLAERPHPRPTILCGTIQPADIADCDCRRLFRNIHWLALTCDPAVLASRLRAHPPWRGCDEPFIERQLAYREWLQENAAAAFDPSLEIVDTTDSSIEGTASRIRDWAVSIYNRKS